MAHGIFIFSILSLLVIFLKQIWHQNALEISVEVSFIKISFYERNFQFQGIFLQVGEQT